MEIEASTTRSTEGFRPRTSICRRTSSMNFLVSPRTNTQLTNKIRSRKTDSRDKVDPYQAKRIIKDFIQPTFTKALHKRPKKLSTTLREKLESVRQLIENKKVIRDQITKDNQSLKKQVSTYALKLRSLKTLIGSLKFQIHSSKQKTQKVSMIFAVSKLSKLLHSSLAQRKDLLRLLDSEKLENHIRLLFFVFSLTH